MTSEQRFQKLFRACPGAWVGSVGHITIDPKRTIEAITFLRRRKVKITGTRMSPGCPGGLQIEYEVRDETAKSPAHRDFECMECGKSLTLKQAEKATKGTQGCPRCGGCDIDLARPVSA